VKYIIIAALLVLVSSCAQTKKTTDAQYEKSSPVSSVEIKNALERYFAFSNVYCLTFPGNGSLKVREQMYSNNAVHLARVEYSEHLMANIVVSTLPKGRSREEEVERLLALERNAENAYMTDYHITITQSDFGKMIGLRINNVAPSGRSDPFPLVRPLLKREKEPLESMSVHRLFVGETDRFEVAVYKSAVQGNTSETELNLVNELTVLADDIVNSLQSCTLNIKK
jgi:hypothetical protein